MIYRLHEATGTKLAEKVRNLRGYSTASKIAT